MKILACAVALALAPITKAQDTIRYDFAIRVIGNTVPSGGGLSSIGVGDEGTFSIAAVDDRTTFPSSSSTFQSHRILDLSFHVGSYATEPVQGFYPSSQEIFGLFLDNNTQSGFQRFDSISFFPPDFTDPEIGNMLFFLQRGEVGGVNPSFLTSLDLPRSLDLSLTNSPAPDIRLPSDLFGGAVFIDVFDVTITVIPTPASAGILALATLTATRRRT